MVIAIVMTTTFAPPCCPPHIPRAIRGEDNPFKQLIPDNTKEICLGCGKAFKRVGNHLGKSEKCKRFYRDTVQCRKALARFYASCFRTQIDITHDVECRLFRATSINTDLKNENIALKREQTVLKNENTALENENTDLKKGQTVLKFEREKLIQTCAKHGMMLRSANKKVKNLELQDRKTRANLEAFTDTFKTLLDTN